MADHVLAGVDSLAPTRHLADWRKSYARRLMITDALTLAWVVFGTEILWLGVDRSVSLSRAPFNITGVSYTLISLIICIAWLAALAIYGTRTDRVIGTGANEYRLVFDSALRLFGLIAIVAFLFKIDLARGYILISFPVGLLVLLATRWMWRQWLTVQRITGDYASRVILVGSHASVSHIATQLRRTPSAGYFVVGAVVPNGSGPIELEKGGVLPIVGTLDDVVGALDRTAADTVVITSTDELPAERVRRISWDLEPGQRHLVVAPSLTDIGGPRIHTRPVAGLPLMHVETPRYEGPQRFTKRVFDVIGSGLLLALFSPILLAVAVAVKATSPGPILYRQERVGRDGSKISMLKFRSMVVDADARLQELLEKQGTADTPLFKVKNDPRLTKVGGFLRKYSIDELPQLFNVFLGDMSLVGPRPQRAPEVALYDDAAWRRLIVQPGMTGLWQVSGRSNLPWEEAIRLDLYYVENWSLTGDLVILWRTLRAVLSPGEDAF
jgi:exopolysaccharide biosynthesis polyprenyl glycosylphosphotransferase